MQVFAIIMLVLLSSLSFAIEEVLIEDPALVPQLIKLHNSMDKVSTAVMKCVDSGEKHSICLCRNKSLLTEFNITAISIMDNSTKLKGLDLVRFKHSDGEWVTLSMQGIRRQVNKKPSCN